MLRSSIALSITRPFLLSVCLFALAACAAGSLHAYEAWARPTPRGDIAAVYLLMHNDTLGDDALKGASTDAARVVEMHGNTSMGTGEAESMMMMPVERVELPAGQEVVFEPGGLHLMLIDLQDDLNLGDRFTLVLHFEHGADLEVEVTVDER